VIRVGDSVTTCYPMSVFKNRRLFILSYIPLASGVQIWDCTDLSTVIEVLHLNFSGAQWKGLELQISCIEGVVCRFAFIGCQ
jgi:hypothetical protein